MTKPALSLIKSDQPEKWQQILSDLITDPKELLEFLDLNHASRPAGKAAMHAFPLKVPKPFARRMEKGNWQDPLLRQIWPDELEELADKSRFTDPLQESSFNKHPGLLHKYQGRVLLMTAPHCAIHCRYCFRRHFDYQANTPGRARWQNVLDYIAEDSSIEEVILSGGDPLAASDSYLAWLLKAVDQIPHVYTIRIHTRLPVVIPQRITDLLREIFNSLRSRIVIIIHCNHTNELDKAVTTALASLAADGHQLLNQAVLLKGVNSQLSTLISLNQKLFSLGVLPYYLHLPDRVKGTAHFDVNEHTGKQLIEGLRKRLPGYLVPRLVREDPGTSSKTILA